MRCLTLILSALLLAPVVAQDPHDEAYLPTRYEAQQAYHFAANSVGDAWYELEYELGPLRKLFDWLLDLFDEQRDTMDFWQKSQATELAAMVNRDLNLLRDEGEALEPVELVADELSIQAAKASATQEDWTVLYNFSRWTVAPMAQSFSESIGSLIALLENACNSLADWVEIPEVGDEG